MVIERGVLSGENLSGKQRNEIFNNVVKIDFYDHGYPGICAVTNMANWDKAIDKVYKMGTFIALLHPTR